MPDIAAQQFFRDLATKLWNAAERLHARLDAAEYNQIVLGLSEAIHLNDETTENSI